MSKRTERCETCRYAVPTPSQNEVGLYYWGKNQDGVKKYGTLEQVDSTSIEPVIQCHRYPPHSDDASVFGVFPGVMLPDWCGEWKPKEGAVPLPVVQGDEIVKFPTYVYKLGYMASWRAISDVVIDLAPTRYYQAREMTEQEFAEHIAKNISLEDMQNYAVKSNIFTELCIQTIQKWLGEHGQSLVSRKQAIVERDQQKGGE